MLIVFLMLRHTWLTSRSDDAAEAARKVKGDYPGQDKEARKAGEEAYEAVRARAQGLVSAHQNHCVASDGLHSGRHVVVMDLS